jgi:hypothetical protein
MPAAILNETIVAGRVVLLHHGGAARLIPWRALANFARDPVGCRRFQTTTGVYARRCPDASCPHASVDLRRRDALRGWGQAVAARGLRRAANQNIENNPMQRNAGQCRGDTEPQPASPEALLDHDEFRSWDGALLNLSPPAGLSHMAEHNLSTGRPGLRAGTHMWTAPVLQEFFDGLIGSLASICPAC